MAETSAKIRKRVEIISRFLSGEYTFEPGLKKKAFRALKREGEKDVTEHSIKYPHALLRNAYRFLTGGEDERDAITRRLNKGDPLVTSVAYLIADGIRSWKDLKLPVEVKAPARRKVAPPTSQPAAPSAKKIKEGLGSIMRMGQAAFEALELIGVLEKELEENRLTISRLDKYVRSLEGEKEELLARNAKLEGERAVYEQEAERAHENLEALRKQLNGFLEKPPSPPPPRTEKREDEFLSQLPQRSEFYKRQVVFENRYFLRPALGASAEEQKQLVKQVTLLAKEGRQARDNALRSKSCPPHVTGMPREKGVVSHVSREMCIGWRVEPTALHFYVYGHHTHFWPSEGGRPVKR